ncbi:MAG: DEAD/DEAH box helicase family protein [Bacteroidota bacterium]
MKQVVIENPIINSPFSVPARHFEFDQNGITDTIVGGRRISFYFTPIAQPKKKGKQLTLETQWTLDRQEENKFINRVRARVALWRDGGYAGSLTNTSRRLLEYWRRDDRFPKLYFCQIEALETVIYITEVARGFGDTWIEETLRAQNAEANPLLYRLAFKMATGTGKTAVMVMLIAWHAINKVVNSQDARFSDSFLVVCPGITIRDRLRVLLPQDPANYYRKLDLVPHELMDELGRAKIVITNFHAFKQRELGQAGKLTKAILKQGETNQFVETPAQMVRRVCRELGTKKNIVVLNDEAHHCYRHRPETGDAEDVVDLKGEDREEAKKREEEARIWISGIEAVKAKLGVRAVYDLSATPFFLKGSGYKEGTLFPWVVSDFSLIDAIESGIVKVPRVPVADDSMTGEQPTYRDLWLRIRDDLPKKGRKTEDLGGEPKIPVELEGALQSLYSNYEKSFRRWEENAEARQRGQTPPVFIVVCNNTNVSNLVYRHIAGWEKTLADGSTVLVPGRLPLFSNVDKELWTPRPNTILVDSEQLESGEGMSTDFKAIAEREIEEFKAEYRARFAGRGSDDLTDEDLLREVLNTVGQPGKLGDGVRCVVSVSMLTEGWDANTVTHILGVRAFGTQLLCEQVVGRGLRRMGRGMEIRSIDVEGSSVEIETYMPEYAEVYGVPFSFIPSAGSTRDPKPGPAMTRVRALDERAASEITFPRVQGYRFELPAEKLTARFSEDSRMVLSSRDLPVETEVAPIVGESVTHTLYDLRRHREQAVAFTIARTTMDRYFVDDDGNIRHWLFPQLLDISRRWMRECTVYKDNAFPQLFMMTQYSYEAADKIHRSIVASTDGEKTVKPILAPYDTVGSTKDVVFDTSKGTYLTDESKCHVSHVALDSDWEAKMAQTLESMSEVISYVKNQNLGFAIPYTIDGHERRYIPDFIVRIQKGEDIINLIVEVTGEKKRDKEAKVATAKSLWVPAVNGHGAFGRWEFIEIDDPWDAKRGIKEVLGKESANRGK